uniref:E3 ubiquitin-protein ligase complex slx8-rfp subunit slx8 n=1 Tax=Lygus hesperus TaxID=30085 RepID=A0A0A9ZF89_LYGHE
MSHLLGRDESKEEVLATPCGHLFCTICLLQAYEFRRKCPVCRNPVKGTAESDGPPREDEEGEDEDEEGEDGEDEEGGDEDGEEPNIEEEPNSEEELNSEAES